MFLKKSELVRALEKAIEGWEKLVVSLSPEEISERWMPSGWSVKDTLAHLSTWQMRDSAMLESFIDDRPPSLPDWPVVPDEQESQESIDRVNAWVFELNRDKPWDVVHREWRENYEHFVDLIRSIPEEELMPGGRLEVANFLEPFEYLPGEYDDHHTKHRALVLKWMHERKEGK